jgi:tetratricopeptide (TPR) repeat protein
MRTPIALLKFVAKALGNAFGGGIAGDILVDVMPDVAKDVWGWWHKDRTPEQCRAEIEAIAQAGAEEIRQQMSQIVQEVALEKPPEVGQEIELYLTQIPASVRRSLRRPADPIGMTVPPNEVPKSPDDLLQMLPTKLSRFKPGIQPLAGVDLELVELLGIGGFGEVWKARNPFVSSVPPVALKFCNDPWAAKVLRNEAAVLDRIMRLGRHPDIVRLLHTYLSAEAPCLEYEYVEGGDLAGLIQQWHRADSGPGHPRATRVMLRLARIMGFAHRLTPPIVHRDLKPANVLVHRMSNGALRLMIADFGIGGVASGHAIRETTRGHSRAGFMTSGLLGSHSPLYASHQQVGGEPPDPRDDVYSLGVIWYQLLTGNLRVGRPGGTRWQARLKEQQVPTGQIELLARCFEDEAIDRFADANALAEAMVVAISSVPRERRLAASAEACSAGDICETADDYSIRAGDCLKEGDYDRAISELTEAIRLDPMLASAFLLRADAFCDKADLNRAIADYSEAIRLDSSCLAAYMGRAKAMIRDCKFKHAMVDAQAMLDASVAIWLDPHCAQAYTVRAEVELNLFDDEAALADATEAIRRDAGCAEAFAIRATVHVHKNAYDRAIADATEAIRLDPASPRAFWARGFAHSCKEDTDRAIADYSEAIRLDPADAFLYSSRARIYHMKGDYERSIADRTNAIRLDPEDWEYRIQRAEAFFELERYDEAITDATQIIRLRPDHEYAYRTRAEASICLNGYKQAIADATEAVRLDPKLAWGYSLRAEACLGMEMYDLAIADATEAIRLLESKDSVDEHYLRAEAYRRKNQNGHAIADATEAIRLCQGWFLSFAASRGAIARVIRARVYLSMEQFDKAVADVTEAIRFWPKFYKTPLRRAPAFRQKDDFPNAIAELCESLHLDPGHDSKKNCQAPENLRKINAPPG